MYKNAPTMDVYGAAIACFPPRLAFNCQLSMIYFDSRIELQVKIIFERTKTNSEWFLQTVPSTAAAGSEERSNSRMKKKKAVGLFRWQFMPLNQMAPHMDTFIFWILL